MEDLKKIININDLDFLKKNHIIVREDNENYLFKYNRNKAIFTNNFTRICKGLVIKKCDLSIVFHGLDRRTDYLIFKEETDFSEIRVYKYYDGTAVNLYYDQDMWKLSTRGCLNAYESKWTSNKSFAELFNEITTLNYNNLDKDLNYSFVLQNSESRNISKINKNQIILVSIRNKLNDKVWSDTQLESLNIENIGKNIIIPEKLDSFSNYEELENSVKKMNYNEAGVILRNNKAEFTKILSTSYTNLENLKGNYSCKLKNLVYLNDDKRQLYLLHFQEDIGIWNDYLNNLKMFIKNALSYYRNIYINKNFIEMPHYIRRFVHELHDIYKIRKKNKTIYNKKITHKVVMGYYHSLDPKIKYFLIKSFDELLDESFEESIKE